MSRTAPLLFLTAPTAHGKTSALLDFCQSSASPVWMLLPHPLAHEILSLECARRAIPQGRVSLFTMAQLVLTLAKRLPEGPTPIDIATQYMFVRQVVRRLADANALGPFGAIAETGGFIRTLTAFLEEWTHVAQPVPENDLPARVETLFSVYEAYQAYLRKRNVADVHTLLWHIVEALEAGRFSSGVPYLLVDGFAELTLLECRLLAALARHGTHVVVALTDNSPRSVDVPFERLRTRLREVCAQMGVPVEERQVEKVGRATSPLLAHVQSALFEPRVPAPPSVSVDEARQTIRFIEAADVEGEIRTVLRQVRHWLDGGVSPGDMLLVVPNLDELAPLLVGISREYDVPLALAREERLVANPLIGHITTLLDVQRRRFRREDLLDIWHSPFFNWEWPDADTVHALERLSAEEMVVRGRETWLDALCVLPPEELPLLDDEESDEASERLRLHLSRTSPDTLAVWRERLEDFFDRVSPPPEATFTEYVAWLRALLERANVDAALDADISPHGERHRKAWEVFQSQLDALARGAALAEIETLPWRTFVGIVRAMVNGVRYFYRSRALDDAVLATDVATVRGVQRPYACLLRLNESVWPSPLPPDPLLRRHERRLLAERGVPVRQPDVAVEATTFYEVVAHASCLVLSRTRFDESGTPWPPSPFWVAVANVLPDDVRGACTQVVRRGVPPDLATAISSAERVLAVVASDDDQVPDEDIADRVARVQYCAEIERLRLRGQGGRYDGILPHEAPFDALLARAVSQTWSATAFRDYALSPVRYFARRVLLLKEPETLQEGMHRRHYGQLVHAILEKVFADLASPLTPETLDEVLGRFEAVASAVFEEAPTLFGFRPDTLWEWEQRSIRRMLRRLLRWEAQHSGFPRAQPYEQEWMFEISLPLGEEMVQVKGIIDRVDVDASGQLHLFDYKTGTTKIDVVEDMVSGRHVQLPLYWWGAQQRFGKVVASGRFVHVRNCTVSGELDAESFAQYEDEICAAMADIVRKVREGIFPAQPSVPEKDGRCARFCAFVDFCRCSREREQSTKKGEDA